MSFIALLRANCQKAGRAQLVGATAAIVFIPR